MDIKFYFRGVTVDGQQYFNKADILKYLLACRDASNNEDVSQTLSRIVEKLATMEKTKAE